MLPSQAIHPILDGSGLLAARFHTSGTPLKRARTTPGVNLHTNVNGRISAAERDLTSNKFYPMNRWNVR